ncbi:hypothetical protein ABW636_10645 [Aquimarina sp. 2201CG1-2-11]|uniref:hypothetical protein n=1 Tax=Aquimarina discodermiae TaxID=3231043 RepID=UPI0034636B1E
MSKLLIHLFAITVMAPSILTIEADKHVYICKGPKSKKYHYDENCRGLSKCSTDISEVSLKDAKKEERTLCGWED